MYVRSLSRIRDPSQLNNYLIGESLVEGRLSGRRPLHVVDGVDASVVGDQEGGGPRVGQCSQSTLKKQGLR